MNRAIRSCLVVFLSNAVAAAGLPAQSVPPQARSGAAGPAQVMILGTYHFANPGLDVVRTEVDDVLSATRQAEIRAIVDALAAFRPTRIAVEHVPARAAALDSLFRAWRSGAHVLQRDETEQLGFRLAAAHGHERVHPIDHTGEFPFGAVMAYAQQHDPPFLAMVQAELERIAGESNRQQRENTISEILRLANDPAKLAADHGMYLRFARVGAGDSQVGADLLVKWYERNIRIFSNLQLVARPGERVIVIIGNGHAPILRELASYDPELVLVEPNDYLPPARTTTVQASSIPPVQRRQP
jgi:hypothetical protein